MNQIASNMYVCSLPVAVKKTPKGVFVLRGLTKIQFKKSVHTPIIEKILFHTKTPINELELIRHFEFDVHDEVQEIISVLLKNQILQKFKSKPVLDKYLCNTPEDIFYWHFKLRSCDVREKLGNVKLGIIGINDFSINLMRLLKNSGFSNIILHSDIQLDAKVIQFDKLELNDEVNIKENVEIAVDCVIAIAPLNQRNVLRYWNRYCVKQASSFFPILINNLYAYIGPYVKQGQKICFECASLRFASNMQDPFLLNVEQLVQENKDVYGYHPNIVPIVSGLVGMEILNHFLQLTSSTGKIISFSSITQQTSVSRILQAPGCPVCEEANA